jgi:hypothetical protein
VALAGSGQLLNAGLRFPSTLTPSPPPPPPASGSNSLDKDILLLQMLKSKDEQLDALHLKVESTLREGAKELEAALREGAKELKAALHERAGLLVGLELGREQLKAANNKILGLRGLRHVRGGLEYAAEQISKEDGVSPALGVQALLNRLHKRDSFKKRLTTIGAAQNLRLKDAVSCFHNIYHTCSKVVHSGTELIEIRFSEVTAPGDRAAVVATFEELKIQYIVLDESGEQISYAVETASPPPTACQPTP